MMHHRYIVNKINSILHSWDPIGYTPVDEYEELSIKLYERIEKGDSREQLVNFVDDYLRDSLGISDVNKIEIDANIIKVLNEYNSNDISRKAN
jgi:hypothetical protein